MDKRYDVIIIGSGAGGGTLARQLAPSGKSILILERGDWLKREAKNWDPAAVFEHNHYISPDTWYDHHGRWFGFHSIRYGAMFLPQVIMAVLASALGLHRVTPHAASGPVPALVVSWQTKADLSAHAEGESVRFADPSNCGNVSGLARLDSRPENADVRCPTKWRKGQSNGNPSDAD
jgi:2-polyprenyl-6-methoxyphenol hydroxylase-like FAD-dependent oxidoreductase